MKSERNSFSLNVANTKQKQKKSSARDCHSFLNRQLVWNFFFSFFARYTHIKTLGDIFLANLGFGLPSVFWEYRKIINFKCVNRLVKQTDTIFKKQRSLSTFSLNVIQLNSKYDTVVREVMVNYFQSKL